MKDNIFSLKSLLKSSRFLLRSWSVNEYCTRWKVKSLLSVYLLHYPIWLLHSFFHFTLVLTRICSYISILLRHHFRIEEDKVKSSLSNLISVFFRLFSSEPKPYLPENMPQTKTSKNASLKSSQTAATKCEIRWKGWWLTCVLYWHFDGYLACTWFSWISTSLRKVNKRNDYYYLYLLL